MRQADNKKAKDKVAIALMLCFCVIALTSIFTIKSNIDKINDSVPNIPVTEPTKTGSGEYPNAPTKSGAGETVSKIPTIDSKQAAKINKPKLTFIKPLKAPEAYVTNEYAMNSLIYSVTLDQFMVHCGVDIEAPKDAQVLAAEDGTVTAVYVDDRYGNSVEITHTNGFITIYSNLSNASMVEIGDVVSSGQIIGGVGTSGLFESAEPAHLHLEMLKDGAYVNPADYIPI